MYTYIKKYKYHNLGIAAVLLLQNLFLLASTLLGMRSVRALTDGDRKSLVVCLATAVVIYLVLNCVLFPGYEVLVGKTILLMNQEMRKDINRKLMAKSYQEFLAFDSGEYLSWYTNDIKEAELQGFKTCYKCMDAVLKLVIGVVVLAAIKIELLFCTTLISVIILILTRRFEASVEISSGKVSHALERFTDTVKEQVSGYKVLKYFGKSAQLEEEIDAAGVKLEEERCSYVKEKENANMKLQVLNGLGSFLNNSIIFGMCALRIIPAEIFFGGGNLTGQVKNSLMSLAECRILLAGARPYFTKLQIDEQKSAAIESGRREGVKEALPPLTSEIQIEHLSFAYAEKPILSKLDLSFQIGGKYAVVGKSGCGKSTLLKLLLGQLTGYEGSILFDGREAAQFDRNSFYGQMAYIEQQVFLFDTTIRENITLGDSFTEAEIQDALCRSALIQDMDNFAEGLDTRVGENGKQLSGGQKQRIAIARALVHNRSILIVDEGTSALDQENAAVIEESLLQCEDLTLILVSHHLKEENRQKYTEVYQLENGTARRLLCGNI